MAVAFNEWFKIQDDKKLNEFKELVEMLQNASLM